jgi:hypothetical protein
VTDARYPERWLNRRAILRLSDGAFRLFVIGNVFAVANRTDGLLHTDDLPLLLGADPGYADELSKAGLWELIGDRWLLLDYADTQTSRHDLEVLDNVRRRDRDKKRRQRAVPRDVPRDSRRDDTRTGQDRTGVGEGQDNARENVNFDDDVTSLPAEPDDTCSVCGQQQPTWLLAERDGRCIPCNQARRIGRADQTDRTAS